ncbi:family 1 glycosylhydrolase [Cryptosporangium sp. NPDC051539]|uniref:family 1 glycosylhydrolase n=1 Tax=Cryptosporangium sp. NPDC051539 TaxID=3363962 RepID=UPI00379911A7
MSAGALSSVAWGIATLRALAAPEALDPPTQVADSAESARWAGDLHALTGASITTHRAVLGWNFLEPERPGHWDRAAVDRCLRGLDALRATGRDVRVTLHHQDLPRWATEAGGWLDRTTALRFADYAYAAAERFGDYVTDWVTSSDLAAPSVGEHVAGVYPTSTGLGARGLPSVHHVLLGHGSATRALREAGVRGGVGTTVILFSGYPATDDLADRVAVEQMEQWTNHLFLDPLLLGRHMTLGTGDSPVERTGCVRPGDLGIIATPQDALTLSWFNPILVAAPENLPMVLPAKDCFAPLNDVNRFVAPLGFAIAPFEGVSTTRYGRPVIPEALTDALATLYRVYGSALPRLNVVDNGMADPGDGATDDDRRDELDARLSWLANAVRCGVRLGSYEYWPVSDNLTSKFQYTLLYTRTATDEALPPMPPIPRDWTRLGEFAPHAADTASPKLTLIS